MRELPLDSLHDEALTKTVGVLVAVGRWAAEEHVPADLADNCPYLPTSTYEPTSGAFVGFTLAIASAQAIAVLVVLPMMWRQATQLTLYSAITVWVDPTTGEADNILSAA